jgi:hypothetical protein
MYTWVNSSNFYLRQILLQSWWGYYFGFGLLTVVFWSLGRILSRTLSIYSTTPIYGVERQIHHTVELLKFVHTSRHILYGIISTWGFKFKMFGVTFQKNITGSCNEEKSQSKNIFEKINNIILLIYILKYHLILLRRRFIREEVASSNSK